MWQIWLSLLVALKVAAAGDQGPHSPTVCCLAVVVPDTLQARLLAAQRIEAAGIFSCDQHLVISSKTTPELKGAGDGSDLAVIRGPLPTEEAAQRDKAGAFIRMWRKVVADGRFRKCEWTAIVSVEAVLSVKVLKKLLSVRCPSQPCKREYVLAESGNPMALQVVSLTALDYLSTHLDFCEFQLRSGRNSPGGALIACLSAMAITGTHEPALLRQVGTHGQSSFSNDECDRFHASFYPFHNWPRSIACLDQAKGEDEEYRQDILDQSPEALYLQPLQPSVLCIALLRPVGTQPALVAAQFAEGVGLFGCSSYMLFSNVSAEVLFPPEIRDPLRWPPGGPTVHVLSGDLGPPSGDEGGEAAPYVQMWKTIVSSGVHESYDWVVKLEPETVFLPSQLRDHLRMFCPQLQTGTPGLASCKEILFLKSQGRQLRGPMEALTRGAVGKLTALDRCAQEVGGLNMAEDAFLSLCLKLLAVEAVSAHELLYDFRTVNSSGVAASCGTGGFASFFPMRTWENYSFCLSNCGYYLPAPARVATMWRFDAPDSRESQSQDVSIFCWALAEPGPETTLLLRQSTEGAGIFSCDEFVIVSSFTFADADTEVAFGLAERLLEPDRTLHGSFEAQAWAAVLKDGRWRGYDWTVRINPSTVLVTPRLRRVLNVRCQAPSPQGRSLEDSASGAGGGNRCRPSFLTSFGSELGPVEVLARGAVDSLDLGKVACKEALNATSGSFLQQCLESLQVPSVYEPNLLSLWHNSTEPPCDTHHALFDKFLTWGPYLQCLCDSGLSSRPCKGLGGDSLIDGESTSGLLRRAAILWGGLPYAMSVGFFGLCLGLLLGLCTSRMAVLLRRQRRPQLKVKDENPGRWQPCCSRSQKPVEILMDAPHERHESVPPLEAE